MKKRVEYCVTRVLTNIEQKEVIGLLLPGRVRVVVYDDGSIYRDGKKLEL